MDQGLQTKVIVADSLPSSIVGPIMPMRFKLPKIYRLQHKVAIGLVFAEGHSVFVHPYRVKFRVFNQATLPINIQSPNVSDRILISVPKRMFKRAVVRQQIRRRIKEAWRLNHHGLKTALQDAVLAQPTLRPSEEGAVSQNYALDVSVLYVANEVLPFQYLEKRLTLLLRKLQDALQEPSSFLPVNKPNPTVAGHPANRGKSRAR